jgi:transposase
MLLCRVVVQQSVADPFDFRSTLASQPTAEALKNSGPLAIQHDSPIIGQRSYHRYTPEFKEQALGKPVAEVARELQISSNLLYGWRSQSQRAQGRSGQSRGPGEPSEADALRALRRENTRLQAENDILKKAAIILGSRPLSSSGK